MVRSRGSLAWCCEMREILSALPVHAKPLDLPSCSSQQKAGIVRNVMQLKICSKENTKPCRDMPHASLCLCSQ